MKIIKLYAENVKRLKAVEITPQDNVVVISGENENGKTSVLDAIWLALRYRAASKGIPTPVRAGENEALMEVDLGDYIVKRKISGDKVSLEVRTPDGSRISSPQKLLDGLMGDLSFDPWEFSRMKEADQRQLLGDLVYSLTEGKVDLASFDVLIEQAKEERREVNREKKRLETVLSSLAPPRAGEPDEEVSSKDLVDQLEKSKKVEETIQKAEEIRKAIESYKKELKMIEGWLDSNLPDYVPQHEIKEKLESLEKVNKRAREIQDYKRNRDALADTEIKVKEYANAIELAQINKDEALENSPLPVKNVRITADGVMVVNDEGHEVPFCQASAAQRLKISLGIAMAMNPKLRVIRIADGSLLDDNSMQIIRDMAEDQDFQVWIEYASRNSGDRIGVYIEDGQVAPD